MSPENSEDYLFASPIYQIERWQRLSGLIISGLIMSVEMEVSLSFRDYSVAPVNKRYRQRVAQLVSWREVLEANGYQVIDRNRALPLSSPQKRTAGIRHDSVYGEMFYIHCVFHKERTSSLCLVPWGFHCFGCGSEGSMVDFVAGINHLRSTQAIKHYFADTFPQMQPRNT